MPYKNKQDNAECRKRNRHKWKQYHKDYFEANYTDIAYKARLRLVKRLYNLDADAYLQMIIDQNNCCAICKKQETYKNRRGDIRPLSVDHDHATGAVRQLLCTRCNSTLGYVNDNADILKSMITYLEKHSHKEH